MRMTLNGEEVYLVFEHHLPLAGGGQATEARLETREHGTVISAYSKCVPGDQYCKAIGRKIALGRLLAFYPRPLRAEIWQQYWQSVNKPQLAAAGFNGRKLVN